MKYGAVVEIKLPFDGCEGIEAESEEDAKRAAALLGAHLLLEGKAEFLLTNLSY